MLRAVIDRVSTEAGGEVVLSCSTDQPAFHCEIVRLLHGDPQAGGPGFLTERVACQGMDASYPGVVRAVGTGSFLRLPGPGAEGAVTFCFWFLPTMVWQADQVLVCWGDDTDRVVLTINADRALRLTWTADSGESGGVVAGRPVWSGRWQFAGFIIDPGKNEAALFHGRQGAEGAATWRVSLGKGFRRPRGPLFLGKDSSGHGVAFNGKVARPSLYRGTVDDIDVYFLQRSHVPEGLSPVAVWDLSREVEGARVVDVAGGELHGEAVNLPARGVTGPSWDGPSGKTRAEAPDLYDAVHLHEDDLDEVKWPAFARPRLPADSPSGIYAARVFADSEEVWLPFIVRAPAGRSPAPVLFVVPTLTWQAYANRALADEHETGVSLYTAHLDGSPNYYSSWRKPHGSLDPRAGFRPRGISSGGTPPSCDLVSCSLYTIHWLERVGVPYDVICDHDLHGWAIPRVPGRKVVLLTGHHEYWTAPMLDHLEEWIESGGNLINLVGNGMYWKVSIDSDRPWIMEVRRVGGTGVGEADPGEWQHSFSEGPGGTWSFAGRPSWPRVGIGFAATGFRDKGRGFVRTPAAADPRHNFIFEGIPEGEVLGEFGLNQGAACGYEMDRAEAGRGTPPDASVVATAGGHAPTFVLAKEDGDARGPDPRVRGDMVYWEKPSGAKIFSVGSVTWTGSLSHNDYDNNVARVTGNVLRRLLSG